MIGEIEWENKKTKELEGRRARKEARSHREIKNEAKRGARTL